MRRILGIMLPVIGALLLTALVNEAAEALDSWQLNGPAVFPEDPPVLPDPGIADPDPVEPLPDPGSAPVLPPAAPPPASTASGAAAIGRTTGRPGVLPSGEATYSIPLAVPPGTNGLTPTLSLEYRHRGAAGPLGAGWSVGGLSAISRCPRTLVQDGASGPIMQSQADRFCLDGQRLVVVNGRAYGSVGAEYRTEIESFARIRSYGTAGAGPQYFVVESADGRVREYGSTADSRIDWSGRSPTPRAWAINRLRDRAGNVIDYRYTEDTAQGSFRLSSIGYNGNPAAGIAATHEMAFTYGARPADDVDLRYVAGAAVREAVRLDRIDVRYVGTPLKRYELAYEPALSAAGHSRLASIRECGREATDCLAPTLLQWQDGVPGMGAERAYPLSLGGAAWLEETKRWWMADINGDGRDDLVFSGGTTPSLRYRLALAAGGMGGEVDTRIGAPLGAGVPLDYDGDGVRDVLMISAAGRWQVIRGGASGLGATVDTGITARPVDYRGADLNGDGLSDLVYSERAGSSGNDLVVRVRYNALGAGFSKSPVTLYEQGYHAGYAAAEGGNFLGRAGQRIDLDGDGREDLLMNEEYSIARISSDQRMSDVFDSSFAGGVPADINGDGCTDFAYPHYQGSWRVRFSGCAVAGSSGLEITGPRYDPLRHAVVAFDWNGDGKDDLLYSDGSANWKVVRSAGDRLLQAVDSGVAHSAPTSVAVADVDGDGLDDLAVRAGTRFVYRAHRGPVPDLLLSIRDGFGVSAAFSYAAATDSSVHAKGNGATYPQQDGQDSRQVVVRLSVSDGTGTGTLAVTGFTYGGLRRELTGRGDLGFSRRVVSQKTPAGLVVEETYRQDFPFVGLVSREVTRRAGGATIRDLSQAWKQLVTGAGAALRLHPYLVSSTERLYEPGGASGGTPYRTTTMTVAAIDAASGQVTDRSIAVEEGAGGATPGARRVERLQFPSLMNDTVSWCLGRPQSIRLSASHTLPGGGEVSRNQSLSWDGAACRLAAVRVEPGDAALQVGVDLGYDRFGNLSRRAITGAAMPSRITVLDWGDRGRFPVRVTEPHSSSVTATWDEALGRMLSLSDANGLATRMEYDAFGSQVAETLPDGRRYSWTQQACGGDCDPRARYRLHEELRDAAGQSIGARFADLDGFGRAIRHGTRMAGGAFAEEHVEFDAWGRLVRQQRPGWSGSASAGYSQHAYDDLGRLVSSSLHGPDGSTQGTVGLRHEGLTVVQTDTHGRETSRTVSAWGDMVVVREPSGSESRYDHDAFGQLLKVRDETGRTLAEMSYNRQGMKTRQSDTDLGTWTIARNALGEVISHRDAKGQVTGYEHDLLGRVTRRTEKEGVTTWVWGASPAARNIGRLVSVTGPGYMESYAYDATSRLASRTIKSDATYQYAYAYDSAGQLASLTYPASAGGFRLRLGYEYADGRPVKIRDLSAGGAVLWELGATDAAGNILDESLGGKIRVVSGFDPVTGALEYRQAASAAGITVQDVAYRWDDAGNLLERRDLGRGFVETFDYDGADRLVASFRNGVRELGLRYDSAGNITWKSDVCSGSADCFTYDPVRRHAVTTAGPGRYGYDGNGNMVSRLGSAVSWYSYNLPQGIDHGSSRSSFWYGPARNRWKQVAIGNGVTDTTVYVGGLLDKVTRAGKTTWWHYVQAPTGTAAILLRYGDGSAPRTYLLMHDHLGSTDAVVDAATAKVVLREAFDSFGKRRSGSGSATPSSAEWAAIASTTRDGFTGHEHLDNLGLVHMNGRVYDPVIGRFMSPDPIVQSPFSRQDLNRYAYAWNNPLAVVDPTGFEEVTCLHGLNGRCQGVTVTGLREWPATMSAYSAWRNGSNGQAVSAAQRDPCGQDGSAAACARSASGVSPSAGAARPDGPGRGGAADYWRGFAAGIGNLAMNSVPVFWLFGDESDFEWFPVPESESGRAGAMHGNVGYLVGGIAGSVRTVGPKALGRIAAPGVTVLGHYPGYVETAERIGARHFNVPKEVWDSLSPEAQWAANVRFLDRVILRGDTVVLSTPVTRARAGSAFSREIEYLSRHGYALGEDGASMVPRGQ